MFREANRQWMPGTYLAFENDRLTRQVTLATDLYTTLRRQYEQVRVQEFDDTPSVVAIDRATPPAKKSWPPRALIAVTATVIAFVVGVLTLAARATWPHMIAEDPAGYEALRAAWRTVFSRRAGG